MDHEAKGMSPLVTLRMSLIPEYFGCDWRDLPNVVREMNNGIVTKKLIYRYKDPHGAPAVCECATKRKGKSKVHNYELFSICSTNVTDTLFSNNFRVATRLTDKTVL